MSCEVIASQTANTTARKTEDSSMRIFKLQRNSPFFHYVQLLFRAFIVFNRKIPIERVEVSKIKVFGVKWFRVFRKADRQTKNQRLSQQMLAFPPKLTRSSRVSCISSWISSYILSLISREVPKVDRIVHRGAEADLWSTGPLIVSHLVEVWFRDSGNMSSDQSVMFCDNNGAADLPRQRCIHNRNPNRNGRHPSDSGKGNIRLAVVRWRTVLIYFGRIEWMDCLLRILFGLRAGESIYWKRFDIFSFNITTKAIWKENMIFLIADFDLSDGMKN